MRRFILLLSILVAFPAFAAEDDTPPPPQVEAAPDQPDIPASAKSGETLEPDITITRKGKKTIQEYRRGGKLYMIKVVPDIGPPYYFIDTDGDGSLETRRGDRNLDSGVNMWKIIEWE
ncbi:MAG: DUF2782 domain-containing protein [Methylococcaceae bacterium]|nr:DUF2782 domain-containing protein [Methylococcaceae bacterium]MDD1611118.1 DUF2782 domain-containing protein [Methylococcaceae bacterium]MDD1617242.1 DUF2782 domain-containing protein [Methylococcaceae bacterium]OYV15783.1 MAG: hypothetical protein CG439_2385 [Methylococcaceae bacterium NSP1-2]